MNGRAGGKKKREGIIQKRILPAPPESAASSTDAGNRLPDRY